MQEMMWVWSLGQEDPLEENMETHSNILAWIILWTEKLMGYSPWGHRRAGLDSATEQQASKLASIVYSIIHYAFPMFLLSRRHLLFFAWLITGLSLPTFFLMEILGRKLYACLVPAHAFIIALS